MKLRVGLVGLGDEWEQRHRPALRALSDRFEVRAVCAEVALRAKSVASEFGATPVDGFRALANREDVDAILMLSPQWYGALPILAACEAGKAIYCAAALDLKVEEAKQIKQRVEKAGIAFMAEFPRRHASATLRLKELIATQLGRPRLMFCHLRRSLSQQNGNLTYKTQEAASNRDMLELVDWCRYVVNSDPTSVLGVKHDPTTATEISDYRMMNLDFSPTGTPGQGAMAQISRGHYMPVHWNEAITFRAPSALQVCCENGIAFVDLPSSVVWFDDAGRHLESLESERPVGEQLLGQFHRAVTSLVRKASDLEDAYRALQILLSAEVSAFEGRRVPLEF